MVNLIRKICIAIAICVTVGMIVRTMLFHIPDLGDYDAQKVYTQRVENQAEPTHGQNDRARSKEVARAQP